MTDISRDKAEALQNALGEEYLSGLTGYIPRESQPDTAALNAAIDVLQGALPDAQIIQQAPPVSIRRFIRDADGAIRRLTSGRVNAWMRNAAKAGGCTQPIRLAGQTSIANRETGEVLEHFDTADLPDKVLYRPCGTRRESQCPACAKVYKYDAHQLIAAGIRGGKGISSSVSQHPAVFVTFTAPSFGLVHSRIVRKHACNRRTGCSCVAQPCRVRRDKPRCPHGKPAWVLSSPQRQ